MVPSRGELILLARVAEQAERYDDMREYMDMVASNPPKSGLDPEERKLLSNAYKMVTGSLRRSWRTVLALEAREESQGASHVLHLIQDKKKTIQSQLRNLCCGLVENVERQLLPSATTPDSKVFYHKINGDYRRYLAESAEGDVRSTFVDQSFESYKTAWDIAASQLPETDPTRLGLALNFSVFYFELLDSPERACHLAKHAFDTAVTSLDQLPDEDAADSIQILQLLKNNLSMWLEQLQALPPHAEEMEPGP